MCMCVFVCVRMCLFFKCNYATWGDSALPKSHRPFNENPRTVHGTHSLRCWAEISKRPLK